ncbi:MAG: phosphotransferase [Burkholderiales bacterium]|nr:phosphotransferase [Burkholderiales bacterium]
MSTTDRLAALDRFVAHALPDAAVALAPASADASFRRYFRASAPDGRSWIVMDAPPEHEDCGAFVDIARRLRDADLNAPRVLAQDLAAGFLLLDDLGTETYLTAFRRDPALVTPCMRDATDALVRLQSRVDTTGLPRYDEALLRRELALFPDWYLERHLGYSMTASERDALARTDALLVANALSQPTVCVHRDWMPRNLMLADPSPGVLDFQDAVIGPIGYDIASMWRDAFATWPEEVVLDGTIRWWEAARRAGLPVPDDFGECWRAIEWTGLQRFLKVLGIFARLHLRDGKPHYLADTPRFVGYVRGVATRYQALRSLADLLDRVEGRAAATGLTF